MNIISAFKLENNLNEDGLERAGDGKGAVSDPSRALPMTSSAKFLARVFFSKPTQVSPLGKKHRDLSKHCTHQMSMVRNAKVSNSRIFDFNFRCKEKLSSIASGLV